MARYLFQGHRDSSGRIGPTLQRLADRAEVARVKRTTLETLFEIVAPMALYSGEAEAALRPAFLAGTRKTGLLEKMKSAGASDRQIFDALKMVFDGKGWNNYTDDALKLPAQGLDRTKPLSSVSNMDPNHSIGVRFKGDLPDNLGGYVGVDRNWLPLMRAKNVTINNKHTDLQRAESLGHELQHVYDMNVYNRPAGVSPSNISEAQLMQMTKLNQKNNPGQGLNAEDVYYHNIGEIRGRLNGLLQTDPQRFDGLASVFEGQKHNPDLYWE